MRSISIRPGVSILAVLHHLNYKAWYALAEFVDNSIQSALDNKKKLNRVSGRKFQLRVDIDFDSVNQRISIKDNAAGIAEQDYKRAFRPAEVPPNSTGLSEFGMGMKSAACWFSPNWQVRTSALGEDEERTIFFDIDEIVSESLEELDIVRSIASVDTHFTEITLEKIRRFPKGNTIKKIANHLASIYRIYISRGDIELFIDGVRLTFEQPKILEAPFYRTPNAKKVFWKKEFDIDLNEERRAKGFVAIREKGNTRLAGLSLFRRGRLIVGSDEDGYKPPEIFGQPNSFASQRLFGEIHLSGFQVSHTKDGIKWEDCEEVFLSKLREELTQKDFPLLRQTQEFRRLGGAKKHRKRAQGALQQTVTEMEGADIEHPSSAPSQTSPSDKQPDELWVDNPEKNDSVDSISTTVHFKRETWQVRIDLSYEQSGDEWLSIVDFPKISDPDPRGIGIKLSMVHPFMDRFAAKDASTMEPLIRIAVCMALAEANIAEQPSITAGSLRTVFNRILRTSFSAL